MKQSKRQAPRRRQLLAGATAALALFGAAAEAVGADNSAAAKAAITDRLHRWTAAFNAQDLATVCGLFAPDLSYTVGDILNGSRDGLCASIRTALASVTSSCATTSRPSTRFLSRAIWRWCGSPGL